jgi:hypothetical protein
MTPRIELCRYALALAAVVAGCGARNNEAPLRSPSQDYRPPPPVTADGKIVGADGVSPGDRLEEGAKVGTDPGLAPGWEAGEHGPRYDPKRRVGGAVDVEHEHEHDRK